MCKTWNENVLQQFRTFNQRNNCVVNIWVYEKSRCWPFIHKSPEMNSAKGRKNDQQNCKHTLITFNYWRFSIWIAENSLNRFIWKWAYILPSKGFYRRTNAQLSQLFDGNRKPAFSSKIYFNEIEFHPLFLAFVCTASASARLRNFIERFRLTP